MEKNENRGTNRYGRRFDEEFKRDAVRMLESGERSAQQLSQELGVSVWSLKRWSKELSIRGQTGEGALTPSEPASALEIARLRREVEFVTRQRDIFKKGLGYLGPGTGELYEVITKIKSDSPCYSAAEGCRALGVSRSGFYDHAKKLQRDRRQQDLAIAEKISVIFRDSRQIYGTRRIQQMLRRQGIQCGKNRIRRLMDEIGLQAFQTRRFRPQTTQSRHTISRSLPTGLRSF